ncbi:MAG: putative Ig domain-containing protein, partial [Lysobacteraceae bacterium]
MSRHATFLAAIAALLFALTLTAAPARAQVTISAGDASGLPGASVSLPLDAAGGFAAVQWDILFPPAALGFQSLQWNAVGSLHAIDSALIAPGHLRIVAYPVACPVGDLPAPGLSGQLRLRIAADAAPGEHPVDVQVAQAVAADASVLPIAGLNGGTVTVLGGPAATAPVFIPGPDGRALALLAVLLAVIAVIVLRRRAGTAFLVALLIISTNPPVSQAAEQGDAPPPTAIIDALLGRAGAPAGADCNGDGILSVADAVCAQQVLCAQPGNQPPSIAPIGNATIQAGDAWSHQASASDPDGDTLTWSLPQAPGGMQVSASGLLTWTPDATQLGDHDVQVRVTDPDDLSASTTFRLSVAEVVVNQPPSIMPLADRLLRVGQTLGVAAQASDPDPGDVLRFSISGAPAGLSLDAAAGRVLWVPSENQVGVHPLTLSVTDQGGLSDSTGFLVTVVKLGGPPLLQALPDQSLMPGQLLDITAQASDPDLPDDELHFSLPLAPTGMQIVAGSGRISWTPTPEQIGPHDVTVRVSDRNGLADFTSFIATVRAPNQPPLARDDGYAVRFGQTLDVPAPGLLDNDEDADGDALSVRLIDPPQRGTLTLNADGAFDYLAGSTGNSVQPNIDLTALLLPQTQASSTYSGAYPSSRLVDGNLGTSWFSARPHGEEWVDILFPSDVTVRSIELYGNRQSASITHAVTAGVLELYDDADLLRFASEELYLTDPEPARDLTFDVAAAAGGPVTDVRRIRLRITGYGSASDVGLAEIRVFGDGVAQALDAVEEWAWTEAGTEVTPSVIDLDGDGFPEIIFTASPDLLLVVDGRDGSERFRRNDAFWYETSPVVGDIDGDGMPEIVYMESNANFVMALEHDGTEKWRTNIGASIGNMALADLDGDGMPEIIGGHGGSNSGITVLNADGSARWTATSGGCGNHYRYCIPLVADVDLDGRPEIIGGNTLHDRDGSVLWSLGSLGDGFNAIGNFDDDPYAEIVLVRSGNVYLLEHDGTIKWGPVALPGGGRGGPPTVADFDGDGRPEIGVAGSSRYAVFDTDGSILWQMPVVDSSSNATGSTVFDFQNDGSAEVVYRDERTLWVFRGADGRVLFSTPIGSSTTAEAPIIADVDGDGQAEIVVSSDNQSQPLPDGSRRQPGLYVFGSSSGDWVAARKIWNQHSYHVTNILADGTIPAVEQPNWLTPGLNHYRQNAFLPGEIDQSDRFTYVANDGQDDSVPATVYLTLRPANAAPEIHSQPDTLAAVGVPYFHAVRALDPDPGDTLTFSLVTAPSGMSIDPATGLIRFTADSAQLGGHPVDVLVRDPLGFSAQQHYVLNVVDAVQVPDVVGQPQGDAESALSSAGFAPGQVALARHPSIPPGAVSAQSPAGGSHAVPGVPVNLTVSTGTGPEDDDNDGDGFTPNQGDCNDNDAGIHPGAPDPEGDGIDQDCDGVDGDEPITALFVQPDSATLLVGEALQLSAFVRFTDGSAQPVSGAANWTATAGAVIDGNGRLIATAPGPVQASASFQGHGGNAQISVIARDAGDNAAPLAEITAPAEGAQLLGPVDILGSASDPNLVRYELLLAPAGSADFRRIGGGVTAVSDGLLGRLDPTTLLNGLYRLRLTVLDAGGNLSFDETLVQIDGMQKVGHFSLAFSDLRLPLSGMPISVERAYDSRDKRQGDFGIGWQLGLASARAYCTRPLGEGWQVVRSGMSYLLYPTAPHRCSIDIPGRNLENFDFTPTPASSPIVPFSLLSGSFRAAPGTLGRLQAIGGINLAIVDAQPGEVSLLDDTTLNLFAPRNLRYTTRDGVRMEFRDGKLTRIEDRNANVLTISAAGIQHSSGKQVQFQRDAQGRIIRLIDPSGAEQAYAYSAAGDLATHTDALGNVTRFHYDADHYLVRIVDPLGRPLARTIYDDDGRVIAFTDGEGGVTSIVRDLAARSETRTLPDGSTTFSRWDERGNLLEHIEANGVRTRYGYNALDQVSTITNALGATQQFDYDDQGRMTRIEHDNGAVYTITPNAFGKVDQVVSPLGAITRYTYDTRGNLISSTDPDGHVRHFAHDARGNRVLRQGPDGAVETAEFDADGLPTAIIDALGHRTEYGYDANGRPQTVSIQVSTADGPRTLTRTDAYDAAGRRIASTDPAGQQTQLELDFAGQTQAVINPLGTRIEQDRDARGDLLAVRYGDGSEQRLERDGAGHIQRHVGRDGQARAMQYGPGGVLTSVLWEDATPGDPDDNMRLSFSTNALGDLSAIVTPEGQALVLEHDAEGRLIARTEQGRRISHEYDALGRKSADIDAAGRRTEYQYDAFDRIVRTTHADGSFTTADYDPNGRLVRRSDESGRDTHFEYDLAGRLLAVLDALGNETRYGWNEAGQRISQTDANGHTTAFEYNAAGRLAAIIRPDGARTAFDYDAAGNLLRRTDADGRDIVYAYDANHRLASRTLDGHTHAIVHDREGRRLSAEDGRGSVSYAYDETGRLTERIEPDGNFLRYRHDRAGRVVELQTPSGSVGYSWDADGRLAQVTDRDGETWTYQYDVLGRVERIVNARLTEQRQYDLRDRITRISHFDAGNVERLRFDYVYDAAGRVLSVTALDGSQASFQYDAAGRLVGESRSGAFPDNIALTLDAVGNRLSMAATGGTMHYGYDSNDRLIEETGPGGTTLFGYDASGRLLTESGPRNVGYVWSADDRLIGVSAEGVPTLNRDYDFDGLLVAQHSGGQSIGYLNDHSGSFARIVEEYVQGGTERTPILFGQGPLAQGSGAQKRHYALDRHSGVRALFGTGGPVSVL